MVGSERSCYPCLSVALNKKDRSLFGGGGRGVEDDEGTRLQKRDQELTRAVDGLEREIDELKAAYELHFLGVEKREPQGQRDLVKTKLRGLMDTKLRSTALRFRIQQLKARMVSLENYWQRTLRQREAGTYRRDIARMKRKSIERTRAPVAPPPEVENPSPPSESGHSIDSGILAGGGESGSTTPSRTARSHHRPRVSSAEELTEPHLRKLYDTYMGARRRCGESGDLRFEEMAAALRKQVPRLMDKTGARTVEFKVVIRGGKAVLKALPKN